MDPTTLEILKLALASVEDKFLRIINNSLDKLLTAKINNEYSEKKYIKR